MLTLAAASPFAIISSPSLKDITEKFEKNDYKKKHFKGEEKKMIGLLEFLQKNKENYNKLVRKYLNFY